MARPHRFSFTVDAPPDTVAERLWRRTRHRRRLGVRSFAFGSAGLAGLVGPAAFTVALDRPRLLWRGVQPVARGRLVPVGSDTTEVSGVSAVPGWAEVWFWVVTLSSPLGLLAAVAAVLAWSPSWAEAAGTGAGLALIVVLTAVQQALLARDLYFADHAGLEARVRTLAAEPVPTGAAVRPPWRRASA